VVKILYVWYVCVSLVVVYKHSVLFFIHYGSLRVSTSNLLIKIMTYIQGVSGGIVNILGGGSMDCSE